MGFSLSGGSGAREVLLWGILRLGLARFDRRFWRPGWLLELYTKKPTSKCLSVPVGFSNARKAWLVAMGGCRSLRPRLFWGCHPWLGVAALGFARERSLSRNLLG